MKKNVIFVNSNKNIAVKIYGFRERKVIAFLIKVTQFEETGILEKVIF